MTVTIELIAKSNPESGCGLPLFATGQQNVGCDVGIIGIFTVPILFYIAINISFIGFNANINQFGGSAS